MVWEGISLQPVVLRKHGLGLWDTDMSRYIYIYIDQLQRSLEPTAHLCPQKG